MYTNSYDKDSPNEPEAFLYNRMANATNIFQGKSKRVLCVCSAGLLRSPTCAEVLHAEHGYNTRAVGISEDFALIPMDLVHIYWADEIVCVSMAVSDMCDRKFGKEPLYIKSDITVLDIPDRYEYGNDELKELIITQYNEAIREDNA